MTTLARMRRWPMMWALAAAVPLATPAVPAQAQGLEEEGPKTLVVAYRADPATRAAFRGYMAGDHAAMLRKLKADGTIAGFRIFFSWYSQPDVWDAMVELSFATPEKVLAWNQIERTMPGGLSTKGLALGRPVLTSSADRTFSGGTPNRPQAQDGAYYVIPYQFSNAAEYRDYAKAYVLPQYDGWLKSGLLASYDVLLNRYPVGDPWDSLVILQYRDAIALGKRQHILDEVRKDLVKIPEWQAYHKRKADIRSETENSVADLIAQ